MSPISVQSTLSRPLDFFLLEPESKKTSFIEPAVIQSPSAEEVKIEVNWAELLENYRLQKSCHNDNRFDWIENQLTEIAKLYDADSGQCIQFFSEVFLDRLKMFGEDILLDQVAHKQNPIGKSIKNWKVHIEEFLNKAMKSSAASSESGVRALAICYSRLLLLSSADTNDQRWVRDFTHSSSVTVEPELMVLNFLYKDPKDFNETEITTFCLTVLECYKKLPSFGRTACQDFIEKLIFLKPAILSPLQVEAYSKIRVHDNKPFYRSDEALIKLLVTSEKKEMRHAVIHLIIDLFKTQNNDFLLRNKNYLREIREIVYNTYSFVERSDMSACEKKKWESDLFTCLCIVTPATTNVEELFKAFTSEVKVSKKKQKRVIQIDAVKSFFSKHFLHSHNLCLTIKLTSNYKPLAQYLLVEGLKANEALAPVTPDVNNLEKSFFSWEKCLIENVTLRNLDIIDTAFSVARLFFLVNTDVSRASLWTQMVYKIVKLEPSIKPAFHTLALSVVKHHPPADVFLNMLPFFADLEPNLFKVSPALINEMIKLFGLDERYVEPIVSLISRSSMEIFETNVCEHDPIISAALINLALTHKSEAKAWTQDTWNKLFGISLRSAISLFDNSGMALLIREMPQKTLEANIDNVLSFVSSSLRGWNRLRTQGDTIELLSSLPPLSSHTKLVAEEKGLPALILLYQKKHSQNGKKCVDEILKNISTEKTFFHLTSITQPTSVQYWKKKLAIAKADLSMEIEENNKLIEIEMNKTFDSSEQIETLVFKLKAKARISYLESLNQEAGLSLHELYSLETTKTALGNKYYLKNNYKRIVESRERVKETARKNLQNELTLIENKGFFFKNLEQNLFKTANEVCSKLKNAQNELSHQISLVQTGESEIRQEMHELFNLLIKSGEPFAHHKASALSPAEQRIIDRINQLGRHALVDNEPEMTSSPSTGDMRCKKKLKEKNNEVEAKMIAMQERIAKLEAENERLKSKVESISQRNINAVHDWQQKSAQELFETIEDVCHELAGSKNPVLAKKYATLLSLLKTRATTAKYYIALAEHCGMTTREGKGSHTFYCFKLENNQTLQGSQFTIAAHLPTEKLGKKTVKQILLSILRVMEHEKVSI